MIKMSLSSQKSLCSIELSVMKIGIHGERGRMGRALLKALQQESTLQAEKIPVSAGR